MNSIDALFAAILRAGGLASLFAIVVALLVFSFRQRLSPAWRAALWMLVVLRFLVPVWPETPFSMFNASSWLHRTQPAPRVSVQFSEAARRPASTVVPAVEKLDPIPAQLPATSPLTLRAWLALVWLAAALGLFARLLAGWFWMHRRLRHTARCSPRIEEALKDACSELRLRRAPRLLETKAVASPGVFGCWRPRILLPAAFVEEVSRAELRHILLHEAGHIKRKDHWINAIISLVQAVHWFNPVLWFVSRQIRLERELACDALVVKQANASERHDYGKTLLKLLERVQSRAGLQPVIGIVEEKLAARLRLQQIAGFQTAKTSSALACGCAVLLSLAGLTNAQIQEDKPPLDPVAAEPANERSQNRIVIEGEKIVETPGAAEPGSVTALVQDARLLIEMGNIKEAQEKLKRALAIDPEHRAAAYYLRIAEQSSPATRPVINRPATQSRGYSSPEHNKIVQKLQSIRLAEFEIPSGATLGSVIQDLSAAIKKEDPAGLGVNFIISTASPGWIDGFTGHRLMVDPATGQKHQPIETSALKIGAALHNVSVVDILNGIIGSSLYPGGIQYSVEDYAVVIAAAPGREALYTRTYRVNPNTLIQNLSAEFPIKESGDLRKALRNRLTAVGVDFEPKSSSSTNSLKAIFLNDRTGVLMVRATLKDLDVVESLLQMLNYTPPQVVLETRVLELDPGASYETDLLLRQLLRGNRNGPAVATVSEILSDPQFRQVVRALGKARRDEDQVVTAPGAPSTTGILTEAQAREVFDRLKRDGYEIVAAPKITTVSDRQARVSIDPGPTVNLLPAVQPDGKSIRLDASVEAPASPDRPKASVHGNAVLWDGQTMVLIAQPSPVRTLVAFITPFIIDPAGNRVHQPGGLPDANSVPEQPENPLSRTAQE